MQHCFSLFDKIKNAGVNRLMIFEYFLKVRVHNSHIILFNIVNCSIFFS